MVDEEKHKSTRELAGDGLGDVPVPSSGDMSGDQELDQPGEPAGAAIDEAELNRLKAELLEMTARLTRAQADFENYRRRVAREREDLSSYANQKLLISFLPVLDNLERALATPATTSDDKFRQGVELTARSFREILGREGVTVIEAVGTQFDPNLHEAVMTMNSTDDEDGTVLSEFQRGYRLADRVIRPSMVQVSKKG